MRTVQEHLGRFRPFQFGAGIDDAGTHLAARLRAYERQDTARRGNFAHDLHYTTGDVGSD